uniref:Uncharacterized protein n=1 Tax=viral metagenome TaxID=1070528 RepID=A0A6C0IJD7_9ZZZZ
MKQVLNQIKVEKKEHIVLAVLLIIYILLDIQLPTMIVGAVDNIFGKVVLYLLAFIMFMNVNPVVGILAFIAVYTMLKRASKQSGTFAIRNYLPSEEAKVLDFSKFNEYPYTLEEEEVARMAPIVLNETSTGSDYKPVLDSLHQAAPMDYEGVI